MDTVILTMMIIACIGLIVVITLLIERKISEWRIGTADDPKTVEAQTEQKYILKPSIMTNCEKDYFNAIREALPSEYILQPQVNLASIIDKVKKKRYCNELFRNIDFGIFDQSYMPIALIEINDKTHRTEKSRMARDYKVKDICKEAKIPLIAFWTNYGVNKDYIAKRIKEVLQ